jgi:hypothetical protein
VQAARSRPDLEAERNLTDDRADTSVHPPPGTDADLGRETASHPQ